MATLTQLQSESAWNEEFVPATLSALGCQVATHFAVPLTNIGTRGNVSHLSGYHRSRRWIKESAYCVSRTYSVSATRGDRAGGDSDAVSAMDIKLPAPGLYEVCHRVDDAMRAGRLDKCTEWFGTFDGQRVTGWDNVSNQRTSSDSSHLFHLHLSFDRGRVAEDHADAYEILTGETMPLTNTDADLVVTRLLSRMLGRSGPTVGVALQSGYQLVTQIAGKVDVDAAELAAITDAAKAGVLASADELVAAVVAALPAGTLTRDDVEAAVRAVFTDAGTP